MSAALSKAREAAIARKRRLETEETADLNGNKAPRLSPYSSRQSSSLATYSSHSHPRSDMLKSSTGPVRLNGGNSSRNCPGKFYTLSQDRSNGERKYLLSGMLPHISKRRYSASATKPSPVHSNPSDIRFSAVDSFEHSNNNAKTQDGGVNFEKVSSGFVIPSTTSRPSIKPYPPPAGMPKRHGDGRKGRHGQGHNPIFLPQSTVAGSFIDAAAVVSANPGGNHPVGKVIKADITS